MKRIFVLSIVIFLAVSAASAQKNKNMKQLRDSVFIEMKLSDENRQKMHDLIAENGKTQNEIKADASLTEEQKMEKLKAWNKELRAKEDLIMNPDQRKIWVAFATEMKKRREAEKVVKQ